MFRYCTDPSILEGLAWLSCYLTTGKHFDFYMSFLTVITLIALTAPVAMALGFAGAMAARSRFLGLRMIGKGYTGMVRGIPDIVFFLFFVIALDQGLEFLRYLAVCPSGGPSPWQGLEFRVCAEAKIPAGSADQWVHKSYGFGLAVVTFALVFGAFAANVLYGAMQAVPRAQLETGEAYGLTHAQVFRRILVPQMWIYALPGLSNLWMILIKATPLLFLLGVQDIVYWARELGGAKTAIFAYPHPDWRLYYFLFLLVFYLSLTKLSEVAFDRLSMRLSRGQATAAGEALRKVGA